MASGSPASLRWGRREFGWSQRPRQDIEVVGGYVVRLDRSFVHAGGFRRGAWTDLARPVGLGAVLQGFIGYWAARTASTIASATSARGRNPEARTNSCGACAPPPRGPRPSTVSGIEGAKWLASLAPPRRAPTIGRPIAAPPRSSSPAVAARESMPGHSRIS